MHIDILCSDLKHPVNYALDRWIAANNSAHDLKLVRIKRELRGGDILFLISCTELIDQETRDLYKNCLVIHASDLPLGRGWSPHVWSILEGATELTITLLSAENKVDSGPVWAKEKISIPNHYLYDEINQTLFDAELRLLDKALVMVASGKNPVAQDSTIATYYPRRSPADSEINPDHTISEAFNLLRVSDPERYPAFVRLQGHVYSLTLKKVRSDDFNQDL